MRSFFLPLIVAGLWASPGFGQSAVSTLGERGSLYRATVALDSTVDLYRLALVDLLPAVRRLQADAASPTTRPQTAVPSSLTDVWRRLGASLRTRVPIDALPALTRAYHIEVVDALDNLGAAQTVSDTASALTALSHALTRVCATGADVVDLFSRRRPAQVHLVDSDTVVDEINEGLDEVARAEGAIRASQQKHRALGDQLQAFLRLEISLGRALDLIAEAQEAGIHIGFEAQLDASEFAIRLASLCDHAKALAETVAAMTKPPLAGATNFHAVLARGEQGPQAEVKLTWAAVGPAPDVAQWRIYRRPDLPALRERLLTAQLCEGKPLSDATALTDKTVAALSDMPQVLTALEPGRVSHTDVLAQEPAADLIYRLVPVTGVGVEGPGIETRAWALPTELQGPAQVRARALLPSAESPSFYRDLDAIEVTWALSASDVGTKEDLRPLAAAQKLPVVDYYEIVRQSGKQSTVAGRVPAGTSRFLDRPGVEKLRAGVSYQVQAKSGPVVALAPTPCSSSDVVQRDQSQPLHLTCLGAATRHYSAYIERQNAERYKDPHELAAARAVFMKRAAEEREKLTKLWWLGVPESQRRQWLQNWSDWVPADEQKSVLKNAPEVLAQRDLDAAHIDIWLSEQGDDARNQVRSYWQLIAPSEREAAINRWLGGLGLEYRRAVKAQVEAPSPAISPSTRELLLWPAQMRAWWDSRDVLEKKAIGDWWQSRPGTWEHEAITRYYRGLPEVAQRSLWWPNLAQLSAEEQKTRLETAYRDLPDLLWPQVLAFAAWQDLNEAEQVTALQKEAGISRTLLAHICYTLRPADEVVGFHLGQFALAAVVGLALVGFFLRMR